MRKSRVEIDEENRTALCEVPLGGAEWMACALFVEVDERYVLAELRIIPAEQDRKGDLAFRVGGWSGTSDGVSDTRGIKTELLRQVAISDLYAPVAEWARDLAFKDRMDGSSAAPKYERAWRKLALSPNPGRGRRSDAYYAGWASLIDAATRAPKTAQNPIAAVADKTGLGRARVRDNAYKARVRGVLTDSPAGALGGGLLTGYGRELLSSPPKKES